MIQRVSFLMPVASPAPFLAGTLDSMLAQSYTDWRLTAVIDGSDSAIQSQIERTIPKEKLTLIQTASRQGISRALNSGIAATQTELIARIDADDVNEEHRLAIQVQAADEWPEVSIVGGAARLINERDEDIGTLPTVAGRDIRRDLLIRNRIVHSSALFRREYVAGIGGYNARCVLREDYELWLRIAAERSVANVDDCVVNYRLSSGQISRRPVPASTLRYVAAARLDAAQVLGVSLSLTRAYDLVWRIAQAEVAQRQFGSLSRRGLRADNAGVSNE